MLRVWIAVLTATVGSISARAGAPATKPVIPVTKAAAPLTIDGDLSEPEWQKVAPARVDYVNSKLGVLSDTPRMTVRYLWDDRYLYIGYEFFTKNLKAQGTGTKEGPAANQREGAEISVKGKKVDVAEFFISFGDPNFFWEIHHNELNQFNDVWITVPDPSWKVAQRANVPYGILFGFKEFIDDEGPYTLATAVKLLPKADGSPSTVNDPGDVDTGYSAEIRIPWYGLGAAKSRRTTAKENGKNVPGPWKMASERLNVLAVYQDDELPERYHHSSPTKPAGGWFHHSYAHWPVLELVDAK